MLRVVSEQAAVVSNHGDGIEVRLDESGVRQRVKLEVSTRQDNVNTLLEKLRAAFRTYEFETVICVKEGPRN
jgi:hypothetical protein